MNAPFRASSERAKNIVKDVLGDDMPVTTWLEATHTSEGDDAVKLVIIFPESKIGEITGDDLIKILGLVKNGISDLGETRSVMISFARTGDEPEPGGD